MKSSSLSLTLNVILIIAVAILYCLHFKSHKNSELPTPYSLLPTNIVYLNSDTVWNDYKFVKDKKKELKEYEDKLQDQYDNKAQSFKQEYEAYLKEGTSGKLSLSQQKKREEELGNEQRKLQEYDKNLSDQFLQLQQKLNNEIQDSIINFIKKQYAKYNYTYVMAYSRNSGILYANDKLDITKDLLTKLNKSYEARHKK